MTTAADVKRLKGQVRDLERILVREGAAEAAYERQLAEAIRERDEARAELLSIAQQLELEREASAQLRAELGERMRETAEAQREACARAVLADYVNGELTPASVTRACRIIQQTRLVTGGEP